MRRCYGITNYQLAMAKVMGPGYMSVEQIQAVKQDRIKHTVFAVSREFKVARSRDSFIARAINEKLKRV